MTHSYEEHPLYIASAQGNIRQVRALLPSAQDFLQLPLPLDPLDDNSSNVPSTVLDALLANALLQKNHALVSLYIDELGANVRNTPGETGLVQFAQTHYEESLESNDWRIYRTICDRAAVPDSERLLSPSQIMSSIEQHPLFVASVQYDIAQVRTLLPNAQGFLQSRFPPNPFGEELPPGYVPCTVLDMLLSKALLKESRDLVSFYIEECDANVRNTPGKIGLVQFAEVQYESSPTHDNWDIYQIICNKAAVPDSERLPDPQQTTQAVINEGLDISRAA